MSKHLFLLFLLFQLALQIQAQNYTKDLGSFREKYKSDFLEDANSPLKEKDFKYLDFYQADSTYCIKATVEVLANEELFDMATHTGITKKYARVWKLNFIIHNNSYSLIAYQSQQLAEDSAYKNYLFVPFNDFTNGNNTYGGGRYIDLNMQDIQDNKIVLDFNKAYNPYCAYVEGYACPIPPTENKLSIEINAGEKSFLKKGKK